MKYYKVFNYKEKHNGLQYKTGLNKDILPFSETGSCVPGGLYFTNIQNILEHISNGEWIREVKVPKGAMKVLDSEVTIKWRASSLILLKRRSLRDISTWKYLIKNGLPVSKYYIEIFHYLFGLKEVDTFNFIFNLFINEYKNNKNSEKFYLIIYWGFYYALKLNDYKTVKAILEANIKSILGINKYLNPKIRSQYLFDIAILHSKLSIIRLLYNNRFRGRSYAYSLANRNNKNILKFCIDKKLIDKKDIKWIKDQKK